MFVRASVFRSIGLLEPKFFLNNEEIDFCSRARRAGFACAFVPDARVWHKISVSFGGEHSPLKEYFSARNRLLWASRNANILLRMRIHASVMLTLVRRLLLPSISGASPSARSPKGRWWTLRSSLSDPRNRAYVIGVRDYYLRRFGDCPDTIRELSKAWTLKRASGAAPQHR